MVSSLVEIGLFCNECLVSEQRYSFLARFSSALVGTNLSQPTGPGGQGRAAPPFQGFSAKSGFGFFLPSPELAGIPFGDLRQPLGAKIMCREKAV